MLPLPPPFPPYDQPHLLSSPTYSSLSPSHSPSPESLHTLSHSHPPSDSPPLSHSHDLSHLHLTLTSSLTHTLLHLHQADHLIGANGKSGVDAGGAGGEAWASNLAPTTLPTLNKNAPGGLELDWVHGYRCHDVRNNLRYTALRKVGATTTRSLAHTHTPIHHFVEQPRLDPCE